MLTAGDSRSSSACVTGDHNQVEQAGIRSPALAGRSGSVHEAGVCLQTVMLSPLHNVKCRNAGNSGQLFSLTSVFKTEKVCVSQRSYSGPSIAESLRQHLAHMLSSLPLCLARLAFSTSTACCSALYTYYSWLAKHHLTTPLWSMQSWLQPDAKHLCSSTVASQTYPAYSCTTVRAVAVATL